MLERLGFGYEWCREINPALIYASNSGFGDRGEWAQRPSFDAIAQSFAGAATAMGGGPSHEPRLIEWTFSDEVGAMHFYSSILAALFGEAGGDAGPKRMKKSSLGGQFSQQLGSLMRALRLLLLASTAPVASAQTLAQLRAQADELQRLAAGTLAQIRITPSPPSRGA